MRPVFAHGIHAPLEVEVHREAVVRLEARQHAAHALVLDHEIAQGQRLGSRHRQGAGLEHLLQGLGAGERHPAVSGEVKSVLAHDLQRRFEVEALDVAAELLVQVRVIAQADTHRVAHLDMLGHQVLAVRLARAVYHRTLITAVEARLLSDRCIVTSCTPWKAYSPIVMSLFKTYMAIC